jgi:hypothetical protein
MARKPIVRFVIAPAAVAGILMLAILAATGNAQESSITINAQESSITINAQESNSTENSQESSQHNDQIYDTYIDIY